jgi:hypothetical protein
MKQLKIGVLLISLFLISNCDKTTDFENFTTDAKIFGFVSEKCNCCWGWIIGVGSGTIKTDSLPGLSPSENMVFPINARITIGAKSRDCSEYKLDMTSLPDYYQIKTFSLIKLKY